VIATFDQTDAGIRIKTMRGMAVCCRIARMKTSDDGREEPDLHH